MSDPQVLRTLLLSNGLQVTIHDVSRHYFGGYWRLRMEARCPVPLSAAGIAGLSRLEELRCQLGDPVLFVSSLEQMAVPPDQVEQARAALEQRLLAQVIPLLEHTDFAARFVTKQYQQKLKRPLRGIPCLT
ncbi:MAG: hypothetical protein FIA89_16485 [Geobacter sp.]|nr:hypothetical protein [Geobacter sp.]